MQIITIVLREDTEGQTITELRYSDGVSPATGAQVCQMAARRFDEMRIEQEVAARLAQVKEAEGA